MKTISQQTGWNRPYPLMICQDHDVLLSITEFSFDMDDQDFLKYFRSRTGLQIGKEKKADQKVFLLTSPDAEKWLLESPEYRYQESQFPTSGMTVPFGRDREQAIKVNRIMKARFQDCWEIYSASRQSSNDTCRTQPVIQRTQGDLFYN